MNKIILMALISAFTAQAAPQPTPTPTPPPPPVTIASLPFAILAPGKYVLASNLSYSAPAGFAILVGGSVKIQGPVTIDFKGFTITGIYPDSNDLYCIFIDTPDPVPVYPITIQNGTIASFSDGIHVDGLGKQAPQITIRNMSFKQNSTAVMLGNTYGATVTNCAFDGFAPPSATNLDCGIFDFQDYGNNTFSNNTFVHTYYPLLVSVAPPSVTPWLPPRNPSVLVSDCEIYPTGKK